MHARPNEVCNSRMLRLRLAAAIKDAIKDDYHLTTSKRLRYRPHYKDVPSAAEPKRTRANAEQQKASQPTINEAGTTCVKQRGGRP